MVIPEMGPLGRGLACHGIKHIIEALVCWNYHQHMFYIVGLEKSGNGHERVINPKKL